MIRTVEEIIEFWIGPAADDPGAAKARGKLWYQSTPQSDAELRDQFGETLAAAERGELAQWLDTADGTLALVILLDQFSRNLYRGQPTAFSNDDKAIGIAGQLIDRGHDLSLCYIGRAFLYHPFEHSESREMQDRSVHLFRSLVESSDEIWKGQLQGFLDYAIEHRDVVHRFGRFPHRNAVLGRQTTPQEAAYLAAGARRYGQ